MLETVAAPAAAAASRPAATSQLTGCWSDRYWASPGCASCMTGHIRSSSASARISLSG
jgi:hypothetical protein